MTQFISRPKVALPLAVFLGFLILVIALDGQAQDSSSQTSGSLSIQPMMASYIERERGNIFSFACTLVNDGDKDITVVTEHLDFSNNGVDKKTNSLRCVLLFEDNPSAANGHPLVPSIYKHAPVTLRPGEATIVHYVQDFSRRINGKKSMNPDQLEADTVTISYKIVEKWGKRFDLWYGEQTAEPVKFNKNLGK